VPRVIASELPSCTRIDCKRTVKRLHDGRVAMADRESQARYAINARCLRIMIRDEMFLSYDFVRN